jgi:phosphate transport system permease protein
MSVTTSVADSGPTLPQPAENRLAGTAGSRVGDRAFSAAAHGAGILVISLVLLLAVFLVSQAAPALAKNNVNFLTSRIWEVGGGTLRFGIADLLWFTVLASTVAMLLAVPVALGVALFLTHYAPARFAKIFSSLVDLLAAVPSIIYGLWGLNVLGPHVKDLQNFLAPKLEWIPLFSADTTVGSAGTIFLAAIVLAIMVLPIVTALSREVFAQTPPNHREAALALGATKWEMIRTAVLPFGRPGVKRLRSPSLSAPSPPIRRGPGHYLMVARRSPAGSPITPASLIPPLRQGHLLPPAWCSSS